MSQEIRVHLGLGGLAPNTPERLELDRRKMASASQWRPSFLGSRLRLWLNADYGVTLNGNNVSAWADLSPSSHNHTQATPVDQPIYTGVTLSSGKQALDFDGANHWLAGAVTVAETDQTIWAVCESDSGAGTQGVFDSQAGRQFAAHHTGAYGLYTGSWGDVGTTDTGLHLVVWQCIGSSFEVFVDGVSAGTGSRVAKALGSNSGVGANNAGATSFYGRIREVGIVAGSVLSSAELGTLHNYARADSGSP